MANAKISDLTALTGANTATGDVLAIEDISAAQTKKITRDELASAIATAVGLTLASSSGPTTLVFKEDTDNGTNKVTITAPAALASDFTMTLPAWSGTVVVADSNGSIENVGAIESNINTVAATGSTEALDTSAYGVHDCTMDQSCTFTFTNPAPSGDFTCFVLILRGAFTPTFPTLKWGDATVPTYTTPSRYVFTTVDAGSTWMAKQVDKAIA